MGQYDKAPDDLNHTGTSPPRADSQQQQQQHDEESPHDNILVSGDAWLRGFQLVDHQRFLHLEALARPTVDHYPRRALRRRRNIKPIRQAGEILAVTEDVALLFALREKIQYLQNWSLRWENHFWHALASLSRNRYSGLILDLRIPSNEPKFVPDFLEEYGAISSGTCMFLADTATPAITKSLLRRRGGVVLEGRHSIESIMTHLRLQ